jgi:general L-amino acid transport system substrate-binding protein
MRPSAGPALILALAVLTPAACNRAPPEPAAPSTAAAEAAPPVSATLDKVRARKRLRCGVTENLPGFSERTLTGWRGFDVDLCRAVAAAVLGDSRAVSIQGLSSRTRFAALQSGAIDVLAGGGSFTFTHDAVMGLDFAGISYFDSQGFLTAAPRQSPKPRRGPPPAPVEKTIANLNGLRICVQGGSAAQAALAENFRARGYSYQPIVKDDRDQALQAYERRECDAITDDLTVLAHDKASLRNPDASAILTETLADDPVGPAVREGDDRWADIVRWTLNALILADSSKLTAATVEEARKNSVDPQTRRLLGAEGETGRRLGLADDWAFKAIRQVGSYGEIFDRNLGPATPLRLERGRNAAATGTPPGLLYAPPLR